MKYGIRDFLAMNPDASKKEMQEHLEARNILNVNSHTLYRAKNKIKGIKPTKGSRGRKKAAIGKTADTGLVNTVVPSPANPSPDAIVPPTPNPTLTHHAPETTTTTTTTTVHHDIRSGIV